MKPTLWPFCSRTMRVRYALTSLPLAFVVIGFMLFSSSTIAVLVFGWLYVALIAAMLVIVLYLGYGSGGRWALSCLSAPVIVLLMLPAIGRSRPYFWLATHYASYMNDVQAQRTVHSRYVTWDWSDQDGFAPPQVWLVYDETDRVAGPRVDEDWYGPEGPRDYCPGRSRHLYGHFYLCS